MDSHILSAHPACGHHGAAAADDLLNRISLEGLFQDVLLPADRSYTPTQSSITTALAVAAAAAAAKDEPHTVQQSSSSHLHHQPSCSSDFSLVSSTPLPEMSYLTTATPATATATAAAPLAARPLPNLLLLQQAHCAAGSQHMGLWTDVQQQNCCQQQQQQAMLAPAALQPTLLLYEAPPAAAAALASRKDSDKQGKDSSSTAGNSTRVPDTHTSSKGARTAAGAAAGLQCSPLTATSSSLQRPQEQQQQQQQVAAIHSGSCRPARRTCRQRKQDEAQQLKEEVRARCMFVVPQPL
jgi:hypothetical protein